MKDRVETDPVKIAARLRQDGEIRRNQPHTTYAETAKQILWFSWQAGRIDEAEYRRKLAEAIAFDQKRRAPDTAN